MPDPVADNVSDSPKPDAAPAPSPAPQPVSPTQRVTPPDFQVNRIQALRHAEFLKLALDMGHPEPAAARKEDVIFKLVREQMRAGGFSVSEGVLELMPDGYGFLRSSAYEYTPAPDDTYVSPSQIRRFGLKEGDTVRGAVRPPKDGEKYLALLRVDTVNGDTPEKALHRKAFEDLTPLHPHKRLFLEHDPEDYETRIINLFAPIGKGQRGLIIAPPRVGKTILLAKIAHAVEANHPEAMVIVLLIDERPEEVTNMRRSVKGEVVASCFDEGPERHAQVTSMVLAKAKRLVEHGKDVVILVDSMTRMGRAYNNLAPSHGRIMSGGMDVEALQAPKMFFGSARQIENGGSLTILATCLIETGSKMDEVIFEEFKGTGNMELLLDRSVGNRKIFPAIDVNKSGTRKEELIMDPQELKRVHVIRKMVNEMRDPGEIIEMLISRMKKYRTNAELLMSLRVES